MTPLLWTVSVLVLLAAVGMVAATVYGLARRRRAGAAGLDPGTALARAASYGTLAVVLAVAVAAGPPGIAALVLVVGLIGLYEWGRIGELPGHHRAVLLAAHVLIVAAVYVQGPAAAVWLVGALVLVGALWPVVRSNTERAVRDLGMAAIGLVFVSVTFAHAIGLDFERPTTGPVLFAALALACAGSDVGAFLVGRRFGRTKLAPALSPNKTRAGVVGNFLGAAVGLLPLAPALADAFTADGIPLWFGLALVPIVTVGAVWGDLFKSAAKREAGVKDFGAWLPGFGGILDRVDSLLMTLPLAYWSLRALTIAGIAT